jgi:RNA polymerase sigma factor (sigma-70 family)
MAQRPAGAFPATRPSIVGDLASVDPPRRAAACEALASTYWRAVYAFIRVRWTRSREDAQDLTQEFFSHAFERDYLSRYDPGKARFRTFVRTCLEGFLANEHKAAMRLKRGGGVTIRGVDFARFDADLAAHARSDEPDPERWFHREWIRSLFADALDRLGARCEADGHGRAFTLFVRYDIDEPQGGVRPTYAALAGEAGLRVTDVTNELAWARRAFREIVLNRLRDVCASDDEFRAEARDLLGIDPT